MGARKWTLRKGGKKERCPQCGQMRFVPFVLAADGQTKAGSQYGRCDREQHCGYYLYPSKSVADIPVRVEKVVTKKPILYSAMYALNAHIWENNSLLKAFKGLLGEDVLKQAMYDYHCGTGKEGECVYVQYDGEKVRTAKYIMYDETGHRVKDKDGNSLPVKWLHKMWGFACDPNKYELKQCLFGQHLVRNSWDKIVVVEAEKTAVLMHAYDIMMKRTDRLFVACGGSQMLKGAINLYCLASLPKEKITLLPDGGQYWNWKRTAEKFGWECVDIAEDLASRGLDAGGDIWDITEFDLNNK